MSNDADQNKFTDQSKKRTDRITSYKLNKMTKIYKAVNVNK